jgi:hypothetical protein
VRAAQNGNQKANRVGQGHFNKSVHCSPTGSDERHYGFWEAIASEAREASKTKTEAGEIAGNFMVKYTTSFP